MAHSLERHSVTVAGHKTSVSLEPEFWDALKTIARAERRTISDVVAEVDRGRSGNLSSALRVYVLDYFRPLPQGGAIGGLPGA